MNAREIFSFQLLMVDLRLKRRHVFSLPGRARARARTDQSQAGDRAGLSPALGLPTQRKFFEREPRGLLGLKHRYGHTIHSMGTSRLSA